MLFKGFEKFMFYDVFDKKLMKKSIVNILTMRLDMNKIYSKVKYNFI